MVEFTCLELHSMLSALIYVHLKYYYDMPLCPFFVVVVVVVVVLSIKESARLRRQMEFLLEELDGHKEESEKIRLQSEKDVQSWKHRLEDTIGSLKSLEEDYNTLKNKYKQEHNISSSGTRQDQRWIDRCHGYEEEISKLREAFMSSEKRAVEAEQKLIQYQKSKLWDQDEVHEKDEDTMETVETTGGVKAVVASMISCRQQLNREPVTAEDYMDHFTSPSSRKRKKIFGEDSLNSPNPPAAVLRELNKVRLSLADAERSNRILSRKYEEAKSKMHELRKVNEQYERSQERIMLLETQYSSALKRLTTMEEVEKQWKLFRKELSLASPADQKTILLDTKMDITTYTPPEISAVIRKIQSIQNEVKEKGEECEKYRAQWEASNQRILTLQSKLDAQMLTLSQIKQQQEQEKKRLDALQLEVDRAQAGERIAKMEAKNLQQLLDTYEVTEAIGVKEGSMKIPGIGSIERSAATGPVVAGLRTSLVSAQEENNLLKETHLAVCKQLEALQGRLDENLTEHERVLEKFNKLKSSLMEEREKAKIAEERALHAESMAGKGFFDPDKTRALHMKENPFMNAVRAKYETQILALEATIERHRKESESSLKPIGSSSSLSTPATAAMGLEGLEAKKLNQRLKDTFQEHIGVFREAVYLLTGYKIDMIMDCDSPRFRVRSMYAEV